MKKSSIVRRIDDLGRIVIPKEIRKFMNFFPGDSLEFCIDENSENVILQRLDKRKRTSNWVKSIQKHMEDNDCGRIGFNYHKLITVCAVYDCDYDDIFTGIAICNPNDQYDKKLGEAIAYCRAMDIEIPSFILKGV